MLRAGFAGKLNLSDIGVHLIAFFIFHHHVIPGRAAQRFGRADLVKLRRIQRIFGIDIDYYAQHARKAVANLLTNTKFSGNHSDLQKNCLLINMASEGAFSSHTTRHAKPLR